MHDLNTLSRLNEASAVGQGISRARESGKHVVARYTGLNLVGFETFDTADQMLDYKREREDNAALGERFKALPATMVVTG
jgi:BMFP domain-containing protein YqiC